jgi:hypothetical protein
MKNVTKATSACWRSLDRAVIVAWALSQMLSEKNDQLAAKAERPRKALQAGEVR